MSSIAPPSNLVLSSTTTLSPTLSWTGNGAQNCRVQIFDFYPSNGDVPLAETVVSGNTSSTAIQIPRYNNTYQVWVLFVKGGTRVPSQVLEVTQTRSQTLASVQTSVSNVQATTAYISQNKLANEPTLTYQLQQSVPSRFNSGDQDIIDLGIESPYMLTGLTESTQYKQKIVPTEGQIVVGDSNVGTFTTQVSQNIVISNLNVSNITLTSATITYATSVAGRACRVQFWVNNVLDGQIQNDTSRSITLSSYREATTQTIKVFAEVDGSYQEGLGASTTFTTKTIGLSTITRYLGTRGADNMYVGTNGSDIFTLSSSQTQVQQDIREVMNLGSNLFSATVFPIPSPSQGSRGNIVIDVVVDASPQIANQTLMRAYVASASTTKIILNQERPTPSTFRFRIPYSALAAPGFISFMLNQKTQTFTMGKLSQNTKFDFEVYTVV